MRNMRGFTVVEMVVVVGIIGLLTSVVLFSVNQARQNARDKARVADIEQLRLTVKLYQEGYGALPTATGEVGAGSGLETDSQMLAILPTIPTDPKTSDPDYGYFYDTTFDCTAGSQTQTVLYVQKFEGSGKSNAEKVCGADTTDDATDEMYVILLQ